MHIGLHFLFVGLDFIDRNFKVPRSEKNSWAEYLFIVRLTPNDCAVQVYKSVLDLKYEIMYN